MTNEKFIQIKSANGTYSLPFVVIDKMRDTIDKAHISGKEHGFNLCIDENNNIIKPGNMCKGKECSIEIAEFRSKRTNIRPTMFRALSSFYEDEKEYNDDIIKTRIVPPTELLSGSGEQNVPSIHGSVWSLNHEYVTEQLYGRHEIHSVLKKKINVECKNGKIEITDPKGCYIKENE